MLVRTVDFMRVRYGANSWETAFALAPRVHVLLLEKKFVDVEAPARDCLAIREKLRPNHWSTFHMRSMLGAALAGQRKFAEAEPLLLDGYQGLKWCEAEATLQRENELRPREALERIIRLYTDWEKPAPSTEWKQELDAIERAEAAKLPAAPTPAVVPVTP